MKIGLLECDDVDGRFPHVKSGYREMFTAMLPGFEFRFYESHRGQMPASPEDCDAWIATGSKHAVYEGHPWVEALSAFIRKNRKPFVGTCFGHQLLAHAMGGEVRKAQQGWGVGVLRVDVLRQEPWMDPPMQSFRIQHMHQDQVLRLPPNGIVLGKSDHCEVGMFRVGETMLGIEGHPEFSREFGAALIDARRERIGNAPAEEALKSLEKPNDAKTVGGWIARFIRTARR